MSCIDLAVMLETTWCTEKGNHGENWFLNALGPVSLVCRFLPYFLFCGVQGSVRYTRIIMLQWAVSEVQLLRDWTNVVGFYWFLGPVSRCRYIIIQLPIKYRQGLQRLQRWSHRHTLACWINCFLIYTW